MHRLNARFIKHLASAYLNDLKGHCNASPCNRWAVSSNEFITTVRCQLSFRPNECTESYTELVKQARRCTSMLFFFWAFVHSCTGNTWATGVTVKMWCFPKPSTVTASMNWPMVVHPSPTLSTPATCWHDLLKEEQALPSCISKPNCELFVVCTTIIFGRHDYGSLHCLLAAFSHYVQKVLQGPFKFWKICDRYHSLVQETMQEQHNVRKKRVLCLRHVYMRPLRFALNGASTS